MQFLKVPAKDTFKSCFFIIQERELAAIALEFQKSTICGVSWARLTGMKRVTPLFPLFIRTVIVMQLVNKKGGTAKCAQVQ